MTLFPGLNPKQRRRSLNAKEKSIIIGDVAEALAKKGYPPMDVGAKNIMASQIGALLKGGYAFGTIRESAMRIALTGKPEDPFRFTHIREMVLAVDAEEREAEHTRIKIESRDLPPELRALMVGAVHKAEVRGAANSRISLIRNSQHDFIPRTDDERVCALCGEGPRKPGRHTGVVVKYDRPLTEAELARVQPGPRCYECVLSGRIGEMNCRDCGYAKARVRS